MKTPGTLAAGLVLLLSACAGGPVPPDWQVNARLGLAGFEKAALEGNTRVAEAEFSLARATLTATGRADLVARAELLRCAVRAASLEFDDCPGFLALAPDAGPEERAYAAFLAGRWQGLDARLLPEAQRAVVAGSTELPADPVSRLVAAGVLLRSGKIAPAGIAAAIDTASANGWRRPLLAWLGVEEKRALAAGDAEAAARIGRRIALVAGQPSGSDK